MFCTLAPHSREVGFDVLAFIKLHARRSVILQDPKFYRVSYFVAERPASKLNSIRSRIPNTRDTDTFRRRAAPPIQFISAEFEVVVMSDQDAMRADLPAPTANDATATTGVPTTYMWNWSANVRANNSELSRSFHVLIFLGSVPKDPREMDRRALVCRRIHRIRYGAMCGLSSTSSGRRRHVGCRGSQSFA